MDSVEQLTISWLHEVTWQTADCMPRSPASAQRWQAPAAMRRPLNALVNRWRARPLNALVIRWRRAPEWYYNEDQRWPVKKKTERRESRHVFDKGGVVCTGAPLPAISGTTRHLDLIVLGRLQAGWPKVYWVLGSIFAAYRHRSCTSRIVHYAWSKLVLEIPNADSGSVKIDCP